MSTTTTPGKLPTHVTMDEAAQALAVSRDTIRRMIRRGERDARKIGNNIRVTAESMMGAGQPLTVAGAR